MIQVTLLIQKMEYGFIVFHLKIHLSLIIKNTIDF